MIQHGVEPQYDGLHGVSLHDGLERIHVAQSSGIPHDKKAFLHDGMVYILPLRDEFQCSEEIHIHGALEHSGESTLSGECMRGFHHDRSVCVLDRLVQYHALGHPSRDA